MIGNAATTGLILAAGVFLVFVFALGYRRSRDPLHPTVFLVPLFLLGLVLDPARRLVHPDIHYFFPEFAGLEFALFIQYLGMAVFFIGLLSVRGVRLPPRMKRSLVDFHITASQRRLLPSLAWLIALFALAAYWAGIWNVGGFVEAYSQRKGGGYSFSGYLGEAGNLGLAALIIYAIGCQNRRLRAGDFVAALIMVSPVLITGTFGGRRGPLFLSLVALFAAYWIARGKLPRPWLIGSAFVAIVLAIIFVQSQRGHLYLGSQQGVQWQDFYDTLFGVELGPGDNFVASCGAVLAASETGEFHYGRRYLITFFITPIPRQIWPAKYDTATRFLYGEDVSYGRVADLKMEWESTLGWRPPSGYAQNTMADFYMEFGWGFLIAAFALGRGIGGCWRRFRADGGVWFVIFVIVAALSIYLPTQSFRAFSYRLVYMSVMTALFWKLFLGSRRAARTPWPVGKQVAKPGLRQVLD